VQHLVVENLAVLDRALNGLGNRDLLHVLLPGWRCELRWLRRLLRARRGRGL